jgi:hypothetical protein
VAVGSVFSCVAGRWGSIPKAAIFIIAMSKMALEAVKIYSFLKSSYLFIFFLPLFTFEKERTAVGFST